MPEGLDQEILEVLGSRHQEDGMDFDTLYYGYFDGWAVKAVKAALQRLKRRGFIVCERRQWRLMSQDDVGMEEWLKLLGLTTNLMTATDAVMEVFTGGLNKTIKDQSAAVAEIAKRTQTYRDARNAVIAYARGIEDA